MRPLLLSLAALCLSACAKGKALECEQIPGPGYAVIYPDGIDRKSDIWKCADGTFHVFGLDGHSNFTSDNAPRIKEAP